MIVTGTYTQPEDTGARTASDGSWYNLDTSSCGDFPECHDEPPTCGH